MKKQHLILFSLLFTFCFSFSLQAQQIGVPSGLFFSTLPQGGQLAHRQAGTFGGFSAADQWIGIGQPSFAGSPLDLYGMRIQWQEELATFSLNGDGSFMGNRNLEVEWGNGAQNCNFNYVKDPFDPINGKFLIMTMTDNLRVGIGKSNPNYKLDVFSAFGDNNFYGTFTRNERSSGGGSYSIGNTYGSVNISQALGPLIALSATRYGAYNSASNSAGTTYGSYNRASATAGNIYGVYGVASSSSGNSYGVYGQGSSTSGTAYAGFFNGDVEITGSLLVSSDKRLKKNIKLEANAIDKIMQLKPSSYEFKNDKYEFLELSEGTQHGFIAQELETVFPEMVQEVTQNNMTDEVIPPAEIMGNVEAMKAWEAEQKEAESFTFKSVNYIAMIPVLTKAIQEQQALLEAEQARNAELQETVGTLQTELLSLKQDAGSSKASSFDPTQEFEANFLFQNVPNPFNTTTEIRYQVQEGTQSAALYIFDLQGKQVLAYDNLTQGEGSVWVTANELDAGMYLYSLVVDGKEVSTQRMILTK